MIEELLVSNLFCLLLVFTRVGAAIMVLPIFGEGYVFASARLLLALSLSVMLMPVMEPIMPPIPDSPATLLALILGEALVGITLGLICRFMVSAIHVAGMVISYQSGLSIATQFDPTQASQGSLVGNLMTLTALVMMLTLDLHLVMLRGVADSYTLFTPGVFPPIGDFANYMAQFVNDIFELGLRLAAPALVVGLIANVALGVLARLMPNLQVFFIFMAPQIFIAFFILLSVYSSILFEFAGFFSDRYANFLEGVSGE